MTDKIEAEVKGTGTRVASVSGSSASLLNNPPFIRAVALELAIISVGTQLTEEDPYTKALIARASAFEKYITGK